jgi:hypothetical protein
LQISWCQEKDVKLSCGPSSIIRNIITKIIDQ